LEKSFQENKFNKEKLENLNKVLIEERKSFQLKIKLKEDEISNLMTELKELKQNVKALKKENLDSSVTALNTCSANKEEDLLLQIEILNERIRVQDDVIAEIKEDNSKLKSGNENTNVPIDEDDIYSKEEDKSTGPKQEIRLLELELEEQREVYQRFKAYVEELLGNILVTTPQILERK